MKIRRAGLIRLWIVLTVIWTVVVFMGCWLDMAKTYNINYSSHYSICSDGSEHGISIEECMAKSPFHGILAYQGLTPLSFVGMCLAIALGSDFLVTGLLAGIYYTFRWIVRGFRGDSTTVG